MRKVDPESMDRILAASHVRPVHVTSGWTVLVNEVDKFAPKTNDDNVAKSRKDDRRRLMNFDDGEFFICTMVHIPVIQANDFRVRNNVLLNGFFCDCFVSSVVEAIATFDSTFAVANSSPLLL